MTLVCLWRRSKSKDKHHDPEETPQRLPRKQGGLCGVVGLELSAHSMTDPTHELMFGLPARAREGNHWAPFSSWASLCSTRCKSEPHGDILPALPSEVRQESCTGRLSRLSVRAEEASCLSGGVST